MNVSPSFAYNIQFMVRLPSPLGCTGCHGADKQKAELRLDSYAAILAMVASGEGWTILTPLALHQARAFRASVEVRQKVSVVIPPAFAALNAASTLADPPLVEIPSSTSPGR